ncbi:MAG: antitoxin Xre-like helix-turn-helix domain-containing protein [Methyloceanibacter sp.]
MSLKPAFHTVEAPADLSDAAARSVLTPTAVKAVMRIADFWSLSAVDAAQLLGISERSWYRLKEDGRDSLSQDLLTRISVLVGIYKGLRLLFSEPLVSEWVLRPNTHPLFNNQRPLDVMIKGGIPMMVRVRSYIDGLRGGL